MMIDAETERRNTSRHRFARFVHVASRCIVRVRAEVANHLIIFVYHRIFPLKSLIRLAYQSSTSDRDRSKHFERFSNRDNIMMHSILSRKILFRLTFTDNKSAQLDTDEIM
jgi:hypothetical protein